MDKKITLKGKKIPRFKSYEEEANFWDTHSPLDYGTWKEVKVEFAKPLEHILGVRMDEKRTRNENIYRTPEGKLTYKS